MENVKDNVRKIVIIGSGPAGYTAGIYTSRSNLSPLILAGEQAGGQLMLTSEVDNYSGFPNGILGPELMNLMKAQTERFGAEIVYENLTGVDFSNRPFKIFTRDSSYKTEAVIIATGASAKWLGLESENRLRGKGVSACATCDGFFFKNKDVAVVGGGDTAIEESLFLTKFVNKITIIHRKDQFRASKIMQKKAFENPKIEFKWNSKIVEILGQNNTEAVMINNIKTNEEEKLVVQGLFVAIGHQPNTNIFKGHIELDEKGYIIVKNQTQTNVEGVFAAGDVHDHRYRQAITAAGLGCMAALDAEKYLRNVV
tara:strand:+ start:399 stop:1334 length:936 start_codon:yes stop_codon:yes gene_type:complete